MKPMSHDGSRVRIGVGSLLFAACVVMQGGLSAGENFKPFKLKTPDGTQRTLADLQGKATLVVFFFPTCGFCNAALPEIQKLHDAYKDRGLSVAWINVVPEEDRLLAEWRAKGGYTVPILLGGRSIQRDYKLTTTPTHYLIDGQGRVLSRRAGYKPGDEKTLEQEITAALANGS